MLMLNQWTIYKGLRAKLLDEGIYFLAVTPELAMSLRRVKTPHLVCEHIEGNPTSMQAAKNRCTRYSRGGGWYR